MGGEFRTNLQDLDEAPHYVNHRHVRVGTVAGKFSSTTQSNPRREIEILHRLKREGSSTMPAVAWIRMELDHFLSVLDELRNLTLFVGAGALLSVMGLALVRTMLPQDLLRRNNEVAGHYLEIVGIIYAVLLGFCVFVVWNEFNDAQKNVELEANELTDLLRIVREFPHKTRPPIIGGITAYAHAVVDQDWAAMARGEGNEEASGLLEALWRALSNVEPVTLREQVLYAEALERFAVISDTRSFRIFHSRPRMPRSLWTLLLVVGTMVVWSIYYFGLESFWAHALMTASMAGSIGFVLFLILDMDRCFSGVWHVSSDQFKRLLTDAARLENG